MILFRLLPVIALLGVGSVGSAQDRTFADAHVHLNDPDAWVAVAADAGVAFAVAMRGRSASHETLAAAAERWPGAIVPFVSVSPEHREYRDYWERDDPTLAAVADSLLKTGVFAGIGEISAVHFPGAGFPESDFDPDGRIMHALLDVAARHDVPVTLHVEWTRLRELESLLADHRDVTVVWAHGGYTPLVMARRLLERNPNLVYELSARTWARHPRSPDYTILRDGETVWPEWIALIEEWPERFVVGSDASLRSIDSDRTKLDGVGRFLDQLPEAIRPLVAHGNLRRVLGRAPDPP
ncbi:amidohydrolase family protein [Gaopeijia maritima]|uniref:TatD family hydrolase n=1 Tax=Gaopeijia maritima TaxID=3119007 RepID=A0ABU9EBH7_9BACT